MAPLPPGADSLDSTRFGLNSPAGRRQRVNGNDLIRDRTIGRKKLARDCFPPDPSADPTDSRPPSWHAEPDRVSHENGPVADDTVARGTHNHDYSSPLRGEDRVTGEADSDYVHPFENAEEGPNPWAGMTQFHMRTAVWDVNEDQRDRIAMGPLEVWTRVSVEGGAFGEPKLRAVVGPLETQAFYEVRDVEYDPAFYTIEPVVEVYVLPARHDRSPILKLVRAGWDGKIDAAYLGSGAAGWYYGAGSPETVVTAAVGSGYRDTTNGNLWVKASGTGNTGWKIVYREGGQDVAVADGGTGSSTAAGARSNLGVGTVDSPEFAGVNVGDPSDTTVTRASAGDIAVEGNRLFRVGGTDVPVADGGTGASTAVAARANLGAVGVLSRKTSSTGVGPSDSSEVTIFTYTVLATTLGTDGRLILHLTGEYFNNSGATRTLTVRVKLAGTDRFVLATGNLAASAGTRRWTLEVTIQATGATNAQDLTFDFKLSSGDTASTGEGGRYDINGNGVGGVALTEDSTANFTFDVTFQHSTSDVNLSANCKSGILYQA